MEGFERAYSHHKNLSNFYNKNYFKINKNFEFIDKEYINKPQEISSFQTYKLCNPSKSFRISPQRKMLNISKFSEYSRNIKIYDNNRSYRENFDNKNSTSKHK